MKYFSCIVAFSIFLLTSTTTATLTFVPRYVATTSDGATARDAARDNVRESPTPAVLLTPTQKGACECIQAIKVKKSPLLPGSFAMLDYANKHARSMAARGRLYQPTLRSMNSQKAFPCGTFLSGASVGRARGTDIGATCGQLWRSRKGADSLRVVVGSHLSSDGVVWCVALFGTRTKFEDSGSCARVTCHR